MSDLLTIEEAQTIRQGDFVSLCRDYGDVWHEVVSDWPGSSLYEVFDEGRPHGKEIHSFEHTPIRQIHRKGEPWKPGQARIICTSSGDYGRTKNGPIRALLPSMTGSNDPEILSYFVFSNSIAIEEKGIELPHGAWVNAAGEVSVWAFAVPPEQIYAIVRKRISQEVQRINEERERGAEAATREYLIQILKLNSQITGLKEQIAGYRKALSGVEYTPVTIAEIVGAEK